MSLAEELLDIIFPPRKTQQLLRTCKTLTSAPYPAPGALALLSYRDPYTHAAIIENKFHGNQRATKLLADVLRAHFLAHPTDAIVIPIPLSLARERERGYNQVTRICASAGIATDTNILKRVRNTTAQTSLDGLSRRTALQGAFTCSAVDPHQSYILIDDVVTTGTTLATATQALQAAGAREVLAIALAH